MRSLGAADVVYSWGVLHHTGAMDRAIELAAERTKPQGLFFIAIYNDQGGASRRWLAIKRMLPSSSPHPPTAVGWLDCRDFTKRSLPSHVW